MPDISVPIHYTGYVSEKVNEGTPQFEPLANNLDKGYVLVSSGGLVDGFRLANLCSAAWHAFTKAVQPPVAGW